MSDDNLEINEPYGSFCVPRKAIYTGLSCRFTYKGSEPYYPLDRLHIKIYIYINDPKKDNIFKKISEHDVAEYDHGDCVNVGQLSNITDNDIYYVINEGNRILPVLYVEYNDVSDVIVGLYSGSILLK